MCSHNSYPSSYEDSLVVTNYLTLFYADSYVIYYVAVSYFFSFFFFTTNSRQTLQASTCAINIAIVIGITYPGYKQGKDVTQARVVH